jgi:osmotically-inducible protein OsmY
MNESKILIIACGIISINAYATTITLTGVINQPASYAGSFYATNNKVYCFGDCVDDRVGSKMIDSLTKAGCSNGMDKNAGNDSDCIIKVNVKQYKKQSIITKVISAKKNVN